MEVDEQMIQDTFDAARQRQRKGVGAFDIDGPCRWSYFFLDESRERLEQAARRLAAEGYQVFDLADPSEEDDEPAIQLRADCIETHDAESLMARCRVLDALADELGLRDYDGFEVSLTTREALAALGC